ncbi:hypothetical protein CVT25_014325 [Psilocybe cyanescens]|uniref:Uncharacterized protein n=1 Tax=Psilocybe cyanescens TaxID=93625 RepID=A0A409XL58_PSICY|nr:hypothetical protein CVT25_014325 [Psilocybe cyanescens]
MKLVANRIIISGGKSGGCWNLFTPSVEPRARTYSAVSAKGNANILAGDGRHASLDPKETSPNFVGDVSLSRYALEF